ncbi:Rv3654c family TadE-like protein [Arthrobacter castelli]|uniref:Rv3654c family TadE-like protein n=1 Tax=Arthrobacter castelli TaxID=271431 RepID=UPI00041B1633|nr:Rv3654c family TadE-like protein [Arthrobacter castelli]
MNTDSAERGSGTVLGAALALVLITLLAALMMVVQAAVGAGRTAAAADLAALAAADAARGLTTGDPCSIARTVTAKNDVELIECNVVNGVIVDITTGLQLPPPWGRATGRSRAGPPPEGRGLPPQLE